MSVIVGYKKDNTIWIAADSRVSSGTRVDTLTESTSKIWRDNNIVMGGVGLLSELQLLRYSHFFAPEDVIMDRIDAEFIYFLYPHLCKAYMEHFGIEEVVSYKSLLTSEFIFAANGHLISLDANGAVMEYDKFCVIGAADDLVKGYLISHDDEEDVAKLLEDAITHAATLDNSIDTNVIIYEVHMDASVIE